MEQLKNKFEDLKQFGMQKLLDKTHKLYFLYGLSYSGYKEFFLISPSLPPSCESTDAITVTVGKRKDNQYTLAFKLNDNKFDEMFYILCSDFVESTRNIVNVLDGPRMVVQRYKKWQKLMKTGARLILNQAEIKGLAGELYFLLNKLSPNVGISEAVRAWTGPDKADQDFRLENCWYEIKTTSPGSETVKISSPEQLDTEMRGELVVLFADRTSPTDSKGVTLNSLYKHIVEEIRNYGEESVSERFANQLSKSGFIPLKEYDDYAFNFSDCWRFDINSDFPCIRRKSLPLSTGKLTYDIILNNIKDFEIK